MEIIIKGKRLRKRRAAMALIAFVLIGVLVANMFNSVNASKPVPEVDNHVIDESPSNEIEIVMKSGDTAWDVQERLTPEADIENLIKELNEINGKDVSNIKAGESVKFIQDVK